MKYTDITLEEGLKKEWVITNGIGGYASSTIIGANTRRYHGLLVAPLNPPAKRALILSKVDESVIIDGEKFNLYSNICKDYVSEGYKYLYCFEKEYVPIYTYKIKDIIIKKYICMKYGENTVTILYRVFNRDHNVKLLVTPILNFRDFHKDTYNHIFKINQELNKNMLNVNIDNNEKSIYMNISEGTYIKHENDSFKNMFYIEEEKRGLEAEENHAIPGRYEVNLNPNEMKDISFVASLNQNIENIDAKEVISLEIMRIGEIIYNSELTQKFSAKKEIGDKETLNQVELIRNFMIAADNFVIYRPKTNSYSIIAGYPWFLDWGRDTLISFEGLLLKTRRFDIARKILDSLAKSEYKGLVPNGYSEEEDKPLYNSADSSLLLFEQVQKYIEYTDDEKFVKDNLYNYLKDIIKNYRYGTNLDGNNIYLDEDFLIVSGTEHIQNTWMDAKIGEYVVTPRNGKVVEINSMWYNALKIMEDLALKFEDLGFSKECKILAQNCKKSFNNKFYNSKRKCLYDVIGDNKIRPNQLFSLSLSYPVINPTDEKAYQIIDTVSKKLLTPYGLKTLAKGEENYIDVYEGDAFRRDMSYHQGITWPWILGIYYNSLKNILKAETRKTKKQEIKKQYNEFICSVKNVFIKEFLDGTTVSGISELYDSKKPYNAKGAIHQAWSLAEVFRIILEN